MNLFDILGPVMVGPSSSHTAGAVRIGKIARNLFGGQPQYAKIYLHGSFADTGEGHGTDRALVAGLLGMNPDDDRIPNSFRIAKEENLEFSFEKITIREAHPNTARLELSDDSGKFLKVRASSVGGGRVNVDCLDDVEVNFTGEMNTLVIYNDDRPGCISDVTSMLSLLNVNIASMQIFRTRKGAASLMVVETDQKLPHESIKWFKRLEGIRKVTYFEAEI